MLGACSTPANMSVQDLNYYKIDCDRQFEQLAFLNRQFISPQDRMINSLRVTSPIGTAVSMSQGTYYEDRATFDRKQDAIAKLLIYQIHQHCPKPEAKPQGCIHVNESFPAGDSQGARCYQRATPNPVVNRWGVIDTK